MLNWWECVYHLIAVIYVCVCVFLLHAGKAAYKELEDIKRLHAEMIAGASTSASDVAVEDVAARQHAGKAPRNKRICTSGEWDVLVFAGSWMDECFDAWLDLCMYVLMSALMVHAVDGAADVVSLAV